MGIHFYQTASFERARSKIEDHIFYSAMSFGRDEIKALDSIQIFSDAIEHLLRTLEGMYLSPLPGEITGEKSSVIHDGRYRVFYTIEVMQSTDFRITLLDIDDNRQSNVDRFPTHGLIEFDDES